jgi:hypothetical protein
MHGPEIGRFPVKSRKPDVMSLRFQRMEQVEGSCVVLDVAQKCNGDAHHAADRLDLPVKGRIPGNRINRKETRNNIYRNSFKCQPVS